MSSYNINRLEPAIRQILASSDLQLVTAKGVRKQLVAQGEGAETIKENRAVIDVVISDIFAELTADNNASDSSEEVPLTANNTAGPSSSAHPGSSLPRPLTKAPKKERKPSVSPTPKREHGGSGSGTRAGNGEMDDEAYARQLQAEYNFEAVGGRASRSTGARAGASWKKRKAVVKKKKNKKSNATAGSGDEDEEEPKKKRANNGNSAFNKELILSDALAALVGESRLSRPQTVKRIWDYVKERDLQDPSDRRYIRCDESLNQVFNTDRLHMFTMNKILAKHFMDPEEVIIKKDKDEVFVKDDNSDT